VTDHLWWYFWRRATGTDGRAVQGARLRSTSSFDGHAIWSLRGREFESHSVQILFVACRQKTVVCVCCSIPSEINVAKQPSEFKIAIDHRDNIAWFRGTRTDGRAVQGARLRSTSSFDEQGIWSLRGREFESHSVQIFLSTSQWLYIHQFC
jgi:hypothetical protein